MNLFPGGFNNLSEEALPCAVQAAQVAIERTCPDARKLLLIPERHTRNVFYLQNVARLVRLLATPGLEGQGRYPFTRSDQADRDFAAGRRAADVRAGPPTWRSGRPGRFRSLHRAAEQ